MTERKAYARCKECPLEWWLPTSEIPFRAHERKWHDGRTTVERCDTSSPWNTREELGRRHPLLRYLATPVDLHRVGGVARLPKRGAIK